MNNVCQICNIEFKNSKGLSFHVNKTHKVKPKEYYIKYINKESLLCPICGQPKKFHCMKGGFNKTCGEHKCKMELNIINGIKTINKKYGVNHISQIESVKIKKNEKSIKKYGVDNPAKSEIIKEISRSTCIKKYGVDNHTKLNITQDKRRKTCKEKYGYDIATKNPYVQQKRFKTLSENKTWVISNIENKLYELLQQKYPDVKRNYKSDLYPFLCDFYIPEKDLYIELNAHWTHGKEPYDENNKRHKDILLNWAEKSLKSKFYQSAINIWTNIDVIKRTIAKENNLNYLEIFDKNINSVQTILGRHEL